MRAEKHRFINLSTRVVCETQIPPMMANSKDGYDKRTNILKPGKKILSQERLTCAIGKL